MIVCKRVPVVLKVGYGDVSMAVATRDGFLECCKTKKRWGDKRCTSMMCAEIYV